MTRATLPNGVVSSSSYDNANRLTGITHVLNGTTLASASYTVDAVGNRSTRTDLAGTQTYGYDNLYRLTSVTYPGPTTTTYSYDAFGNRTQKVDSSGTTSYAYDDADRITSVTPPSPAPAVGYTWDNNGNLTNRGSDSFAWDYEDRMTSATVGGTTLTYAYRGDGLRDSATTGGVTKGFTWDVNAGLPVILDDGSQYVYGAGLVSQVAGANIYYYLADGLGSTMATTDSSGAVVNSYTYDVYGKTTASSGSQANDFQFAGQQTDPTGLQYLRARYYDPETGGFLSRDPLAAMPKSTSNGFRYAAADPVMNSDPTGNICVGPFCADGDGVSVAGHELTEGARTVADWVRNTAWQTVRAAVNKQLSSAAEGLAKAYGGTCKNIGDGIIGCGGLGKLLDALGISGHAFTLGNVILTSEKSVDDLPNDYKDHEIRHSDQWALFGLAAMAVGRGPLEGQGAMFVAYMLNVAAVTPFEGGACKNVFEIWANLKDGHYTC